MDKKILYRKDTYFNIFPKLKSEDLVIFKQFINNVKKTYISNQSTDKILPINYQAQNTYFFWELDEEKNAIVVNDLTNSVENDIFNQLITLIYWLFQRKYHVKGTFFFQIGNLSEFILMSGMTNSISHHIVMDNSSYQFLEDIENIIKNNQSGQNFVTKNLLENILYVNHGQEIDECSEQNVIRYLAKNSDIEEKSIIANMHQRLTSIENRLKNLTNANIFMWKLCGIISFFTITSLIAIITSQSNKN